MILVLRNTSQKPIPDLTAVLKSFISLSISSSKALTVMLSLT